MVRFPLTDLLDEKECYRYLKRVLHPNGMACPNGHPLPLDQAQLYGTQLDRGTDDANVIFSNLYILIH